MREQVIVVATPHLTDEQRAAASAKAVRARQVRAQWRQQLQSRQSTLADIWQESETDEALARMKVRHVLESLPGVGPVRAAAAMTDLGIAQSRRLRGLGRHQIAGLLERFAPKADAPTQSAQG